MGQNNLDHIIRETLSNHHSAIDTNELWSSIQQTKRRAFYRTIIFIAFGLALAGITLFTIYLGGNSKNTTSAGIETDNRSEIVSNNVAVENESSVDGAIQNQIESNEENQKTSYISELVNTGQDDNTNISNTENLQSSIKEKNNSDNQSKSTVALPEASKQTIASVESPEVEENLINSNLLTEETSTSSTFNRYVEALEDIEVMNHMTDSNTDKMIDAPGFAKSTECPTFGKSKNRIFAEVYTTADYASHSLSSGLEFADYLTERQTSQSAQPGYSAGLQFKYLFDNGLFVKGGLEYGVSRERFRYRKETITTEIRPNQVIGIEIDMNGDTTLVLGNAPVTTIETKNWRVNNTYKSLGVPISVGYQIERGPWFYSIEAGIVYNFLFDFNGMHLDETLEPIVASSYFQDNTAINYAAGLTAGYRLTPNMNFIIRSNFRMNGSNINSTVNLIDHRITSFGAGIGLEYEF